MRPWLSIIIGAAAIVLAPFAVFATDNGTQPAANGPPPPVAQSLVREGEFAVKLAAELDLGAPTEEAAAEEILARAGIAPANGWLSDYPMTPQIIGELNDAVSKAAGAGRISMTPQQAQKGLSALTAQYKLPMPAEAGMTTAGQVPQAVPPDPSGPVYQPDPGIVNNYYYDEGPPVVTYYPPPPDYGYLYDYVPYPVVWFGFWWPGFFVCHDFTTVVVVRDRPAIVSNHVVVAGSVAIVDPIGRHGPYRPVPVLRTSGGTAFRTVADFRAGIGGMAARPSPATVIRSGDGRRSSSGLTSITARTGAANIYSRSIQRNNATEARSTVSRSSSEGRRSTYGAPATPSYNRQGSGGMVYREEQRSGNISHPESSIGRASGSTQMQQRSSSPVTSYGQGTERPTFPGGQFRTFSGAEKYAAKSSDEPRSFPFPRSNTSGGGARHGYSLSGRTGSDGSVNQGPTGRMCGMRC